VRIKQDSPCKRLSILTDTWQVFNEYLLLVLLFHAEIKGEKPGFEPS
jgi:hypothetical protein